jgi:Concanavalin A-like lectin/glucanases superfamily
VKPWAVSATTAWLVTVAACNALTGVGELETGDQAADSGVGASTDARVDDGASADGAQPPVDAAQPPVDGGADAPPPSRPAYCTGITLYVPFDDSLTSKAGQPAETPNATPTFVAGKFDKALDLSAAPNQIYYATTFAGKPTYAVARGTVAFWLKPTWTPPCAFEHTLFKPKIDKFVGGTPSAGPIVSCQVSPGVILAVPLADGGSASTTPTATPDWVAGGWNLVVGTWNQGTSELVMFASAGVASATATPWTPQEATAGMLRLGGLTNTPNAAFDELVVWDRELNRAGVEALRSATKSVGDACGL